MKRVPPFRSWHFTQQELPMTDAGEEKRPLIMELYTVYLDGKPRALLMGHSEEQAVMGFRSANLSERIPGVVTSKRSADTPFEEFVRLAMEGICFQMYAGAMAAGQRRH